jgi:hypothetical protein
MEDPLEKLPYPIHNVDLNVDQTNANSMRRTSKPKRTALCLHSLGDQPSIAISQIFEAVLRLRPLPVFPSTRDQSDPAAGHQGNQRSRERHRQRNETSSHNKPSEQLHDLPKSPIIIEQALHIKPTRAQENFTMNPHQKNKVDISVRPYHHRSGPNSEF